MPATKDLNGTWTARFYYTDSHGTRKQKFTRGFKTKKEALEYEREFIAKSEFSVDMKFQSLYELYFEDLKHRVKETTLSLRRGIFEKRLLPHFKNESVSDITPMSIRNFQNKLLSYKNKDEVGYSQTYLKLINNTLSSILNYAVSFHGLQVNPCSKTKSIGKTSSSEMQIWTLEEFNKFSEYSKENIEAYTAFNTLFWTGMRLGEMLALTVKDIDFKANTISINKTYSKSKGKILVTAPKTEGSIRVIQVSKKVIKILEEYVSKIYKYNDETRLFIYHPAHFRKLMKDYANKAEIKIIRIHDLRHSHASLLIHLGINPLLISKRLGHEKVDTTLNIYSHLYPDASEKMIEMLEEL